MPNTLLKNKLLENDDLLFSSSDQKMIEIPDPDDEASQEQKSRSRSLQSGHLRRQGSRLSEEQETHSEKHLNK